MWCVKCCVRGREWYDEAASRVYDHIVSVSCETNIYLIRTKNSAIKKLKRQ